MNLVKVLSTEFDYLQRRIIKFLRYGKSDIQTAQEITPFGIDSNPLKDMIAVYGQTGENGKTVILGYVNKNQIARIGETRIFSKTENGADSFYIHLKNNETLEIGGTTHNLVRYTPLNTALIQQATDITTELTKISTLISSIGLVYPVVPIQINISDAKIEEIKTL